MFGLNGNFAATEPQEDSVVSFILTVTGGSGFSLSFGCAFDVLRLVREVGTDSVPKRMHIHPSVSLSEA